MFARYAPLVAARGGRVIFECRKPLERLFRTLDGVTDLVIRDEPLRDFDCFIPHNSLPGAFGTTIEDIPSNIPYLSASKDIQVDSRLLEADDFKVGFVWAGSPTNANDKNRSCLVEHFEILFELPTVSYFSLQVGDHAADLDDKITDNAFNLGADFADFADTAASIAALDLIISVDTSVAHLAGAMGKPVWTLLPYAGEWRWLLERDDSPWYPTMKLFRQKHPGDWQGLFEQVREELSHTILKQT
jgi:ADP-heptose:LPS heptosyltransferase